MAVLLSLGGVANAWDLSGKVVNPDGSGRGGVTVSSTGAKPFSTVTYSDGSWYIVQSTGVQARSVQVGRSTGRIRVQDGRIRLALEGRDPSGRILTDAPDRAGSASVSAARAQANAPDTLVYGWNGKVFLRDTVSASRSGMVRVFDTTWNARIVYGYLTDDRDGQIYRTVGIGSQTWMAQNLNFKGSGADSGWACGTSADSARKYGRVYRWASAMGLDSSCNRAFCGDGIAMHQQGRCPEGWHVPSDEEWQSLEVAAGMDSATAASGGGRGIVAGVKLKSTWGWTGTNNSRNGTDVFGFRLLPAGIFSSGSLHDVRALTSLWSASEVESSYAWYRTFGYTDESVYRNNSESKGYGFSLRCIQN